jgi:hypothetical protein
MSATWAQSEAALRVRRRGSCGTAVVSRTGAAEEIWFLAQHHWKPETQSATYVAVDWQACASKTFGDHVWPHGCMIFITSLSTRSPESVTLLMVRRIRSIVKDHMISLSAISGQLYVMTSSNTSWLYLTNNARLIRCRYGYSRSVPVIWYLFFVGSSLRRCSWGCFRTHLSQRMSHRYWKRQVWRRMMPKTIDQSQTCLYRPSYLRDLSLVNLWIIWTVTISCLNINPLTGPTVPPRQP